MHTISLQTFFVWAFKIVVDPWKFTMLLLYILWDNWPFFMISGLNEQLQQQLEYTLLNPDCHSWCFSKMQSDTLEEPYAIKFCFKLGKNATETYRMLFDHLAWIKHEFLSGIRDSRKTGNLWGMIRACARSKEVNRPELIGQRVRDRVTIVTANSLKSQNGTLFLHVWKRGKVGTWSLVE